MTEKMFNIGKIINTHGVRGEVKIKRITDFAERFQAGETVYIKENEETAIPLIIAHHRIHKGFDLLTFEGMDNINDVEKYKGLYLQIHEEQQAELEENEYYYHEIIGCKVYTAADEELGTIKEILAPGANDVWVLQRAGKKDAYIPYIESVVKRVDVEEKRIMIEPMEGLLD